MVARRAPSPPPSQPPTPTGLPTPFPTYSAAAESKAKRQRYQLYKIRGLEALGVIAVSGLLSITALAALARLFPYKDSLQERLTEIDTQVEELQVSVSSAKERLQFSLGIGEQLRTIYNREGYILHGQKIVRLRDSGQLHQDAMPPAPPSEPAPDASP